MALAKTEVLQAAVLSAVLLLERKRQRLLVSLEGEDFPDDVSGSWRKEIERRRQDFRDGKANPVPAEEALRQAHAAIE